MAEVYGAAARRPRPRQVTLAAARRARARRPPDGVAQRRVGLRRQVRVGGEDARGQLAGAKQGVAVAGQAGELEIGHARLPRPHHLALAADLEVAVGELEAVRGLEQRLQPRLRGPRLGAARRAGRSSARCSSPPARAAGAAGPGRSARRPRRSSPWRWARRCRPR